MTTIRDWLNSGRNYDVGVAIYHAHGVDDDLKVMFAQGHSEYRMKRLIEALRAIKDAAPALPPVETEPEPIVVAVKEEVLPENQVKPEEDPYRKEWVPLYQRMNYLRHNLRNAKDDEERGVMAHEILDLERQCMRIWYRRDYFLKYKEHLPEVTVEEATITDRNELHRQLCNIRSNLAKTRKKLTLNPEDAKLIDRKKRFEAEVKRIETMLNLNA